RGDSALRLGLRCLPSRAGLIFPTWRVLARMTRRLIVPFKMRLMSPIVSVLLVSAAHGSPTGDAGARAAASTVVKRASATVSVAPATTSPPVQLVESRPVESGLGNPALPAAHDVWLEMIRAAKRSLDFEEFYLSTWPHEPTEDLIQAIGEAARHGVKVRLL